MPPGEGPPHPRWQAFPPRPPTARQYPEVVTRTRNPVRRVFHFGIALSGWVLFAVSWYFIFARNVGPDAVAAFLLLLLALIGVVAVDLAWVAFNLGVYRMRGSRTQVRHVPFRVRRDCVGRLLRTPGTDVLKASGFLRVRIAEEGRVKIYEVDGADAKDGDLPSGYDR